MRSHPWHSFHQVLIVAAAMFVSQGLRSPMAMAFAEQSLQNPVKDSADLESQSASFAPQISTPNVTPERTESLFNSDGAIQTWHISDSLNFEEKSGGIDFSSASHEFQTVFESSTLTPARFVNIESEPSSPESRLEPQAALAQAEVENRDDGVPAEGENSSDELVIGDPELGELWLRERPVRTFNILDPELGVLRLQEAPLPAEESYPWVYWRTQFGFFWTDNVLSASEDPANEGIYQIRTTLSAYPELNSRTFGVATLSGGITRYSDEFELDTQQFDLGLGLYHAVTTRAYIQGGWQHEQFFSRSDGDRFLSNHTLYLNVGRRDRLTSQLSLDTAYAFEYSLADPNERSRVFNRAYANLTYQITPNLTAGLFYQFEWTDFTQQDRNDFSHQVIGSLNYDISSISQLSVYAGRRLGDSSESFIDLDSTFLGVSLSINLPLF